MKAYSVPASLIAAIAITGMSAPVLASSDTTTDTVVHKSVPLGIQYAQATNARPEFDSNRPLQAQRPEFDSNRPLQAQRRTTPR